MIDLEERLTSLLNRKAAAVEVRSDLDGVLEAESVTPVHGRLRRARSSGRWPLLATTVAAAAAAVVGALLIRNDDEPTVEVEAPAASEPAATRFLLMAPAWQVEHIEEFSGEEYGGQVGSMSFDDGSDRSLSVNWYPAERYGEYVSDRQSDAAATSQVSIDGRDALLFEYSSTSASAVWLDGLNTFELRGDSFPTVDDFLAVAAQVREVDEATWLEALPEDTNAG